MADILAMVKGAKPREVTEWVCLDDEINTELQRLGEELGIAETLDENSFAGGNARQVREAKERMEARARERSIGLRMRALHWTKSLDLDAQHPPRDENKGDRALGYNQATYYPALVMACTVRVEHHDGTEIDATELDQEWWDALFTSLNVAQANKVFSAAHLLNRQDSAAPFMLSASTSSQPGGGNSEQPEPTASASAGSGAKSRPRSRKSSSATSKGAQASG